MKKFIIAVSIPLVFTLTPAYADPITPDGTVTKTEFNHVQPGWSRYRVQHTFGTEGDRVAMWAGPHGHRHLLKQYPAEGGGYVQVEYIGPPKDKFFAGPYHLRRETWPSQ